MSHAYFFKGSGYVRYNILTDLVDVGPAAIAEFWTHLPAEFQSDLDAVVNWGDGHAYFFKGSGYVRYNILTDLVDVGPAAIAEFWTHLPAEFQSDLDTVVNWGNGHAYFFKGSGYVRYNIRTDLVDVGPAAIAEFWTHLPAEFQSDLDAVVNWGDGHAYFFKDSGYVRYNIATDLVDVGPAAIAEFWTHLPAEFQSDLDDVINWDLQTIIDWSSISADERMVHVMELLVETYGYPVDAAAGVVGNLFAESAVIPSRLEDSAEATPMRAPNFQGRQTDFTADEVIKRNLKAKRGPRKAGVGLAQWTSAPRRAGLFTHQFGALPAGSGIVFQMDAQVDYLVTELRRPNFAGVEGVLMNPAVTVNAASDEVVYNFENPAAVSPPNQAKRPRTDPNVQALFATRRNLSQRTLDAYRAVHS